MFVVIGVLLIIVGAIMIWFNIPYSSIKSEFNNDVDRLISENKLQNESELFTEDDFSALPDTIQK